MRQPSAAARREMKKLADFIAKPDRIIDMANWFKDVSWEPVARAMRDCGTICCAAGQRVAMDPEAYQDAYAECHSYELTPGGYAERVMHLTSDQGDALFTPKGFCGYDGERDVEPLPMKIQKRRLRQVLLGKRKLTPYWLYPELERG